MSFSFNWYIGIKVETIFIYDALLFHAEGLILCEKIAESNTGNLPLEGVGKQVKYGNWIVKMECQ